MKKNCNGCGRLRLSKFFHKRRNSACGLASLCKICCKTKTKKDYQKRNKEKQRLGTYFWYLSPKGRMWRLHNRLRIRLKPYNMTPEQYGELLKAQSNKCAICRVKLKSSKTTHV